MDGFYNNKSQFQPKPKAETIQPNPAKLARPQPHYDDMAWLGSTQDYISVVENGAGRCVPKRLESKELYGPDWLMAGTIKAFENHYFTAGNEIRVAMIGYGGGVVRMSHQVNSRKVEDNGRIQGIATTRDALRDQYFEPQAQIIPHIPIGIGDFEGDGRTDFKISSHGAPVSYKHDDESAKIVAWEIHAGAFRTESDVGADSLSLVFFIRATDLPKFKIYADGWGVNDVIFYNPSWFQIIWEKILSTKG